MLLALLLVSAIAVSPDAIVWKDAPPTLPAGSKTAVLEGDPRSEGMFTMRVRVPAGASLAPHWHPRDERVTVLSGAVELGFGTTADKSATKRYGAGSFYVNPPRTMHYVFFPEETVLQMTGIGPWEIHTTDIADREPASATLTLRRITPEPNAKVDESTVVDYDVQNFRPDTYSFSVQFETTTPNRTFTIDRVVTGHAPPAARVEQLAVAAPDPPADRSAGDAVGVAEPRRRVHGMGRVPLTISSRL